MCRASCVRLMQWSRADSLHFEVDSRPLANGVRRSAAAIPCWCVFVDCIKSHALCHLVLPIPACSELTHEVFLRIAGHAKCLRSAGLWSARARA